MQCTAFIDSCTAYIITIAIRWGWYQCSTANG